jgi:hypothetical protein
MHDQPDPQGEEIKLRRRVAEFPFGAESEKIRFSYANQVSRRSNSRIVNSGVLQACETHAKSCIGAFTRN